MAQFEGSVDCISVSDGSAFTTLRDGTDTETFILYFGTTIPSTQDSFTRVLHSMWLSMLREAMTSNLTVRIIHPTNSAEIQTVQLRD